MAGPYPYPEEERSRYEPEQEESDDRFGEARAFQENEFEAQENEFEYPEEEESEDGLEETLTEKYPWEEPAKIETVYQNEWDKPLHLECQNGNPIYRVKSEHDNSREDRRWRFDCKNVRYSAHNSIAHLYKNFQIPAKAQHCSWHYRINTYDEPMFFMCPANQFMAGVRSRHSNSRRIESE